MEKWINGHFKFKKIKFIKNKHAREGFKKKKKNLEFSRFGLNHPPTLVITENLEKNKIFIVLKWFLGNFEQFWKNLFFHPRKCQNT